MPKIVISLVLLLTLTPAIEAGIDRVQESIRPLQRASTGRNICTASSINEKEGYWLTAEHCVTEPVIIEGHAATVIHRDAYNDLAILQTPDLKVKALKVGGVPRVGHEVRVVGHPMGMGFIQVFRGNISSLYSTVSGFPAPFMMFDMYACGGNSGSPILDRKDRVVSVLQIGVGRPCGGFSGGAIYLEIHRLRSYFG